MKRILPIAVATAALIAAGSALAAPEAYTVDPRHTLPTFEVLHFGFSMQRGRFNKTSGRVVIDVAARKGSAEIAIEAVSVSTGIDALDERIRGEDFLNAANYPVVTFKSDNFAFDGERLKSLTGELTMNGVARPVTFTVNTFGCIPHPMLKRKACGCDILATIKVSDFAMKYSSPYVADEVTLRIGVEALKEE